ncbi:DUF2892 domain-containing protein [Flavobacteriaceae bacterium XHP0103]|uniref:YgaP family membrane protein n=1 Tax=Marixanthotalea marina TaxID=2844359 RepID=UPI002989ED1A|nr:DUF2892 domain-containing protein [Marixanthotalea marina]MBU3822922.1 DUF2892 domain-containing protein [Marixanthotalea marina]
MKKNIGDLDRGLRIVFAIAVAALYFSNIIEGTLAYILMVLATIFLLTSFIGFCPLYSLFGMKTCKTKEH